jgi:hypothetical protein
LAGPDFAGGVPFDTQQGVISVHPGAVVKDTNYCGAAARDRHFDPARTCVDAVLDQFFHDRCRSFDHFSRGNLACDFIR